VAVDAKVRAAVPTAPPSSVTSAFAQDPLHESWLPSEHSLYRPRHGTRQRTALISAVTFFCLPLLLLILGVRPEAIENRRLASFPSPADGFGFFTGMNQWATDSLPLRANAVRVEDWISRNLFAEPPPLGQKQPDRGPIQGPVSVPDVGPRDSDQPAQGFPKVIEGKDGWYYLGYDIQGACRPDLPLPDVIAALRRLRTIVEKSGRKFVFVVAPDKSSMVPEHLPDKYAGASCARAATAALWQRLVGEAGVIDIRPLLAAASARTGESLYTPVDSHWNYTAGLVMTTTIAETVQPGVTSTWRVSPADQLTRAGDLPPLIDRHGEYTVRYYDLAPDGSTVRSRLIDDTLRQPVDLSQPVNPGVVSQTLAVMADSFTERALPYLAGGFSNVTIMHNDTVRASPHEVAKVLAAKDVVVFEAIQRSLAGGTNALLSKDVLDAIDAELSHQPRR
jgi:alginate O-acetyltransferase complex protein AlgJ